MPDAVIVDAIRTPIGRAVKGSLKSVRADDLAAIPLKAILERNPQFQSSSIVDVMMGCGFAEGESGYNIGRNAALLAGIDYHVPGTTVNRFCASSLQTTRMAFHAIKAGEGDTYIACGVEAVSRATQGGEFEFHPKLDGSEGSLYNVYIPMGLTAENVAEEKKVSREAQDEWAVISQNRAVARAGVGPLRRGNRPGDGAGAQRHRPRGQRDRDPRAGGHQGRRPPPGHDAREAGVAEAGVQAERHGDGGQRLPAQRRRRRAAGTSEERAKELG